MCESVIPSVPAVSQPIWEIPNQPPAYKAGNWESEKGQNYRKRAKTLWPVTCWIEGHGRYAVVAYCRITSVSLHRDLDQAKASLAYINYYACGGMCIHDHEIVDLEDPA